MPAICTRSLGSYPPPPSNKPESHSPLDSCTVPGVPDSPGHAHLIPVFIFQSSHFPALLYFGHPNSQRPRT